MKLIYVNDTNALNFDKENKQNITFAKYFSPTCPACVAMESEWDNMCKDIEQKYDTDLLLAQIDGNGMNKLEQTDTYSDVAYVPSLILLKNGQKVEEYNGPKKKDEMIEFLLKKGHIKPKMRGGIKLTRRGKRTVSYRGQRKGKKFTNRKRQRKEAVSRLRRGKRTVSRRGQRKGAVSRRGQRKTLRRGKRAVGRGQRKTLRRGKRAVGRLRRGKKGAGPNSARETSNPDDFSFIQNEKWLKPFLIALTKNIDAYSKNDNEPHKITSEEAEDFAINNVDRVFRPTMLSSNTKNQYKYDWSKCPEKQQLDTFDDCRISQGFGNNIVPGARKFDPKYHVPISNQNKKEKRLAENSYKYLKNMKYINIILRTPSSDYTRFSSDKKDETFIEYLRNIERTQKDSYRAILEAYGYQEEVTTEGLRQSLKETNHEIDETKLFINDRMMKQEPSVDDENRNSFFNE